jgi:membrane fusion protein (multidrug efflux system)
MPAGDRQYVYRIVDGKAVRTEVSVGMRQQDRVEIVSGLDAGAQVITAGQMKIMDGSKVQPLGNAMAGETGEIPATTGGE